MSAYNKEELYKKAASLGLDVEVYECEHYVRGVNLVSALRAENCHSIEEWNDNTHDIVDWSVVHPDDELSPVNCNNRAWGLEPNTKDVFAILIKTKAEETE